MKEENAEDGVRIERFFRPDPRVRQCRPGTRKPNGRGRWSRAFGSQCGNDDQDVDRAAGPVHENEIRSSRIVRLRVEQSQDWTE